ncbi:MAG: hypothetical protein BA863_03365 [Desulfovibrio sp. S3730MH75]|nr:MAG: hypothetical protein BA863_03365 [Desulfovibrio sp. S3730MH75]
MHSINNISVRWFSLIVAGTIFFITALSLPSAARTPEIYIQNGIDFGTVFVLGDGAQVFLDARDDGISTSVQTDLCQVSGGHPGELVLVGFEDVLITLSYPSVIDLKDSSGVIRGSLTRLAIYSDLTPIATEHAEVKKVRLGGKIHGDFIGIKGSLTGTFTVNLTIK